MYYVCHVRNNSTPLDESTTCRSSQGLPRILSGVDTASTSTDQQRSQRLVAVSSRRRDLQAAYRLDGLPFRVGTLMM